MLDALSQALFTLILRAHLASDGQTTGSLALLSDKRLGRAWQAMLADPAFEWTVEGLAEMASMSRATFLRAFARVAGASPWVLLTQVRMEMAFNLLSHSHLGLSDIAVQVGYQSQSAFSKKFKEFYGEAPNCVAGFNSTAGPSATRRSRSSRKPPPAVCLFAPPWQQDCARP